MRLVIISDTHMEHENLMLPDGDVLIHCGDFSSYGRVNELIGFVRWLSNVAPKYGATFVIAGNHDRQLEIDPSLADVFGGVAEYLFNSGAEYKGKHFWGSPFQPAYNGWAFNLPRDGEELRKNWAQVPSNCDVLITHSPPYRILDGVSRQDHVGCKWLRERIEQVKPKLAVWGHVHEARGLNYWSIPGTVCINATNLDGQYELVHEPVVFDLED
jgi:Icc-related predicted phosphoesterase